MSAGLKVGVYESADGGRDMRECIFMYNLRLIGCLAWVHHDCARILQGVDQVAIPALRPRHSDGLAINPNFVVIGYTIIV